MNMSLERTNVARTAVSRPRRDLADLGDLAIQPSVERAVAAVRDFLGMDVAYATEILDDQSHLRVLRGDGQSFAIREGMSIPLKHTYCQRVLDGRLPNLMPDVRGDERSASLPATEAADIGAFATVPITLSDGQLYGTLCAASHEAQPSLGYRDLQFLRVFARIVADQIERAQQQARTHALELQAGATSTLLAAVGARDGYTGEHSRAVLELAVAVADRLGLDEAALDQVRQAALLHDVGKIAIPDDILNKPGPLTPEEWEVMRTHPIISEGIATDAGGLEQLAPVLRAEHERWDGAGYPDGLAGEQIPLASRITFVCDAYHAMTSDRPYRAALPLDAAREQIAAGAGTQFCPSSAQALLDVLADA
jgi:HD-GYP domain-containing protein (c-di-GMP phosphodiesterase class II)